MFLLFFIVQIGMYLVWFFRKEILNPWISLGFVIVNTLMLIPMLFGILFISAMANDSGNAIASSILTLFISSGLYLLMYVNACVQMVRGFANKKK